MRRSTGPQKSAEVGLTLHSGSTSIIGVVWGKSKADHPGPNGENRDAERDSLENQWPVPVVRNEREEGEPGDDPCSAEGRIPKRRCRYGESLFRLAVGQ